MTTREIPLFLDGPEGQLEALHLAAPDAKGVALICHPHPLFAGTMQNKVVATLQRAARDAGYATLRFNFRGVGQSAGSYAEGRGEIDDALAAARWLAGQHPGLPLTLMGFSFGSCVAAMLPSAWKRRARRWRNCSCWRRQWSASMSSCLSAARSR